MTSESFDKALEGLKQRQPSPPFTVQLIGGRRFEVDQGRALVVRDGADVFISPGGVPVLFDHDSVNPIRGGIAGKREKRRRVVDSVPRVDSTERSA